MKTQLAALIVLLLPGQVFAQPNTSGLEERLTSARGRERLEVLVELTKRHHKQDPSKAETLGTEALEMLEGFPDRDLELETLNSLGHALGALSQYREALEYATRAEDLAREKGDQPALAFALGRVGYAYQKLTETPKALERHNEALSIYQQLDDRTNAAFSLTGRCMVRWRMGEPAAALEDCLEAYRIYAHSGNRDELTEALNNIGLLYSELGQADEALEYYQRALGLQQEDGNKALVGRLLNNMGLIYAERGYHQQGLDHLFRSLKLKEEIGDRVGVSRRLSNIGDIYVELGELDEAREYHRRALAIARDVGFKAGVTVALGGLAEIHVQQAEPHLAIRLLQESTEIDHEIGVPSPATYLRMSEIYTTMGRFQKALEAHREYEKLKSEIFSEDNSRHIAEMQARFEGEQKQKEIELLEQQQAVATLELEQHENFRRALMVGFGLVLGILFLAFNRYRHKARATAMEQAVERERAVNARLREVDKLKDEFLANTSHELRTPLYGMTGLAESLIDGATGGLSEATKANLSMIVGSGRRLSRLVDDILDFSKLRHKSLDLDPRPVDLRSLTDVVLTLSRPLVGTKGLQLVSDLPADLPAVMADENRLQQILHNLVGNAVKFTESGSVEVSAAVSGERIEVRVIDTGIGIPADQQESIFAAFEQGDASIEREYGGTGLGLAVTRQLVELHGGMLEVASDPGKGSVFSFTLPAAKEAPEADAPGDAASPVFDIAPLAGVDEALANRPATAIEASSGAARILLVDDDPVNLQVLRNYLAVEHFDLTLASSGEEALRLLEQETFDLVLLDVMMPKLSGYEVCRVLREKHPIAQLPVVFLTAKSQDSDVVTGMDLGANDYLTKPISKDRLLARVRPHLSLLHVHRDLEDLVDEKMAQVKVLKGLLPICAGCKKIRDDHGYWDELEVFIGRHSEAEFSHGICPDCTEQFYAEKPELRPSEPA